MEESLRILKPYLRGLPLILIVMVMGYLAAAQYLKYVTPMYESVTRLRLADTSEGVSNSNLFKDFDVFVTSNKIAAEIEVLKSEMLIDKTLDRLDFDIEVYRVGKMRKTELYDDSPLSVTILSIDDRLHDRLFDVHLHEKLSYKLIHPNGSVFHANLGDTLEVDGARLVLSLNEEFIRSRNGIHIRDHYQFKKISRDQLISQVKNGLTVIPVDKDVAVIRLIFASPHPVKASRFSDMLAHTYINDYIHNKSGVAKITKDFLNQQINEVNRKLSKIESDIEAFRNRHKITNIPQESETILRQVSQMKIQQTNLLMNLSAVDELHEYIRSGAENFEALAPNFESFSDMLSTELVKKIQDLRAEKRTLLLVFTPQEERIRVIDKKLADLFAYLTESISNTRRNLEIKYENLSRDIRAAQLQLVDIPGKERQLTILKREFDIYQESYNFLNEKKIEAEIAHAAAISFHRIIQHARVPQSPFSPNYIILKIVSALLAGTGAIALIFLVHTIKARVNDLKTIETSSAIPVAAATPRLKKNGLLQKHFLHQVNQLDIKKLIPDQGIITLNSFRNEEGGPFHAIHMAEALSRQNRRILLVDAENKLGLSPLGAGETHTVTDWLSVVHLDNPSLRYFTNSQMAELVDGPANSYDLTVISNAPIGTPLSLQIMRASTVNFVVVDSRLTPARLIPRIDLLKEEFHFDHLYFILNRLGYNPNVVFEFTGWVLKKLGFRQPSLSALTYVPASSEI